MPLSNDVIRQRLQLLEEYIRQLQSFRNRTLEELTKDVILAWAIEHGLQLSIQCVIDVCHYLVAQLGLGVPNTSEEAITFLQGAGIFPPEFAQTLVAMTRFRNILVHVYTRVKLDLVHDNLQNHLDDFTQFARYVISFLDSSSFQ